jgi:hypothetical protein
MKVKQTYDQGKWGLLPKQKLELLRKFAVSYASLGFMLLVSACHSVTAMPEAPVHHQAMISRGGESIYLDRVSNASVMKEIVDSNAKTIFCSFLVGWQDSTVNTDKDQQRNREKYFQYDMQKDWVALVKGDSLYPVFFQERPGLNQQFKEGIMVFELPRDATPDSLVYKDSFGSWGKRLFVLNLKSPYRHVQD